MVVENNPNPEWNQQILFNSPKDIFGWNRGYFLVSLKEIHRDLPYDTLVFSMDQLVPYFPYNLTMNATHKNNPAREYKVHFSFVLETPMLDQEEKLVAVVINSIKSENDSI